MGEANVWQDMLTEDTGGGGDSNKLSHMKFAEGITIIKIASPEKKARWVHFLKDAVNIKGTKKSMSIDCIGMDECPICALRKASEVAGETPRFNATYKTSVLAYNKGNQKVEVIEQGKGFMSDLVKAMNKAWVGDDFDNLPGGWTPDKYDIQVRREGMGMNDTKYTFKVVEAPTTESEQAVIDAVEKDALENFSTKLDADQIRRILAGEDFVEIVRGPEDSN